MLKKVIQWLFPPFPEKVEQEEAPAEVRGTSFFSTDIELDEVLTRDQRISAISQKAIPRSIKDDLVYTGDGKTLTTFAQDASNGENSVKNIFTLNQVGIPEVQASWYGSQGFIGYQLCALIAQHWLVNKACLIPARDAIRKGFKITVNDGSPISPEILSAINKANKRYRLNKSLTEFVKMGRVFGVRVALFVVESDDPDYYVKPFNPDAVKPGSYRGITQIDPYWCVPELTQVSAGNPAALDFYEPTYWIINNQRYHKSHLVIMRGPEVADILKPSYLYGGLSVPQMIYERVYAAERTANEAPQLALTKRSMVFYTDVAKALANQGVFESRLNTWSYYRDNYGVKVADKDDDTIEQHDTSLADLDAVIMTQYQIVASAANVPATKLLGTTPKGFNSSGDYETDSYREELESIQTHDLEPLIDRHLLCLIRSEIAPAFGIAPFAVDCTWEPLDTPSSKELAEVNKLHAETAKILAVDIGAIDAMEVRERISADEASGYNGLSTLTDDDAQDDQADSQA